MRILRKPGYGGPLGGRQEERRGGEVDVTCRREVREKGGG